ncbi:MAG: hypothetical protein ACFFE6_08890 [Candidatus Thorarchaeota archaeon]
MSEQEQSLRFRLKSLVRENLVLLLILVLAAIVWTVVFSLASFSFLSDGTPPLRSAWSGSGSLDIFGLTVYYEFEGWADYDFYYLSWADNFLNGFMPYTDDFNTYYFDGVDYATPYFLPPLYLYLCSFGALFGPLGPGALISICGYVTAFPVYGIAAHISDNSRVGEIAAATYLFNPLVLYHTTYKWMNPAPFVLFTVLSFYLIMKQRKIEGTLAIITAVLFKQIAAFFALPLIAYLIRRNPETIAAEEEPQRDKKGNLLSDSLDLRGFLKISIIALVYLVAWSFPYILDPRNYIYYMTEKPGGVMYESVATLPDSTQPITFTVIFILFGAPEWLSEIVNIGIYYTLFLLPGVLGAMGLSLFEEKDDRNLRGYWRRILFYTLILAFCVHIFSPRGIYKYYCIVLIPFTSILSSGSMMSKSAERIKASVPMVFTPTAIGLIILLPNRNVYLFIVILIMLVYIFHKEFSIVYDIVRTRVQPKSRGMKQ